MLRIHRIGIVYEDIRYICISNVQHCIGLGTEIWPRPNLGKRV